MCLLAKEIINIVAYKASCGVVLHTGVVWAVGWWRAEAHGEKKRAHARPTRFPRAVAPADTTPTRHVCPQYRRLSTHLYPNTVNPKNKHGRLHIPAEGGLCVPWFLRHTRAGYAL